MDNDCWPDLMRDLADEEPWAEPQVVVAELRSYDNPWLPGARMLWSALVAPADLEALGGGQISFNYDVETSGRRPGPEAAGPIGQVSGFLRPTGIAASNASLWSLGGKRITARRWSSTRDLRGSAWRPGVYALGSSIALIRAQPPMNR